ncbi:uncharacterized protein EAE98_007253 [Botrytis deweyae]|uniref:NADAR domain-containing protein n=1 Tax=Botrytis deweyae TaxID=2478750 RepID=A0ABQ7IH39_9HELO|nr:uncharacterized protein EAE98_007253 [Botrytis deweyae]KAF7924201.1 hypothetical protein EAE98_007253 [Botrytis deweyae]
MPRRKNQLAHRDLPIHALPARLPGRMQRKTEVIFPKNMIGFHNAGGKWGFLSNFHKSPLRDNLGRTCYFQAGKTHLSQDPALFEKFLNAREPQEAKNLGNKVQIDVVEWDKIWQRVMFDCLWYKVLSNPKFRLELLHTADCLIVEMRADNVWGSGLNMGQSAATPVKLWPGKNRLGELWMCVREILMILKGRGVDLEAMKPENFVSQKSVKASSKIKDSDVLSDSLGNGNVVGVGIEEGEDQDEDETNGDKDIVVSGALIIDHATTGVGNSGMRSNSLSAAYPLMNRKRKGDELQSLTEKVVKRLRVTDNKATAIFNEDVVTSTKAQPMPENCAACDEKEGNGISVLNSHPANVSNCFLSNKVKTEHCSLQWGAW